MPIGLLFILLGLAGLFGSYVIFANWRAFWDIQGGFYRSTPRPMRWLFWTQHRWWPDRIDPFIRWAQTTLSLIVGTVAIIVGFALVLS